MASVIEAAKRAAGKAAVANHYPKDAKFVGIGSGSTIVYVVEAIKESGIDTSMTRYVPTGFQSKQLILSAGLTAVDFDSLPEGTVLDVAFDGADEVDDELNLIKGGGACLFRRKLWLCRPRSSSAWQVSDESRRRAAEIGMKDKNVANTYVQTRANSSLVSSRIGNIFPLRWHLLPPLVS